MDNIGSIFKKLRLEKKYSLKQIAEGILSISLLSKFERNESDITITKFFLLIERLNISLEEFNFILNDFKNSHFENKLIEINHAYSNNNLSYLINLEKEELKKWHLTKNISYRLNSIMIRSISNDLDNSILVNQKEIDFFVDYLFEIDNWNLYEVILFGNSLRIFNKETVIILSKEMLKKTYIYSETKKIKEELVRVIINSIIFCLEERELDSANFFLISVEKILGENSTYYFEKTKILYLKGLYYLLIDKNDKGKKMCLEAISIMKSLGNINLSYNHEKYMLDIEKNFQI